MFKKNLKKFLYLLFVVMVPFYSFCAVISDNDGSAFITKAEFDSLKNNFQSQIDQYNNSIDNKIDNAIASYLAGITVESKQNIDSILWNANQIKKVYFSDVWAVPTTLIGDKRDVTSFFWWVFNVATYDSTNRWRMAHVGMLEAQSQTASVATVTIGNEDTIISRPEYNSKYGKYYIDNGSFWNIIPKLQVFSFVWHDNISSCTFDWSSTPTVYYDCTAVGLMSNRNSSFRAKNYTTDVTLYGCTSANYTYPNVKITYITSTVDSVKSLSDIANGNNINVLASNQVSGTVKSTLTADWNTTNNTPFATYNCNTQYGWKTVSSHINYGSSGMSVYNMNSWPSNLPTAEFYSKKNTDLSASTLIHNGWSSATGYEINYYSGIPLFTTAKKGVIELPLEFEVDGSGGGADFVIKSGPFNNSNSLGTQDIDLYLDKDMKQPFVYSGFTGSTASVKLYFEVEANKTYWIKVKSIDDKLVSVNTKESQVTLFSKA